MTWLFGMKGKMEKKKKPFCCDVSEVYFCLLLLADSVSVRILWSLYLYFIYALEYISQNLAQN